MHFRQKSENNRDKPINLLIIVFLNQVPSCSAHQVKLYLLLCLLAAGPNWNGCKHAGAQALSRKSAHNRPIHVLSVRPQTAFSEFVAGMWRFLSVLFNLCVADGVLPTASFCRHSWWRRQLLIYQQKWYSVCPQWASAWALGPIYTLRIHSATNDQPDTSHFSVRVELFLLLFFSLTAAVIAAIKVSLFLDYATFFFLNLWKKGKSTVARVGSTAEHCYTEGITGVLRDDNQHF